MEPKTRSRERSSPVAAAVPRARRRRQPRCSRGPKSAEAVATLLHLRSLSAEAATTLLQLRFRERGGSTNPAAEATIGPRERHPRKE